MQSNLLDSKKVVAGWGCSRDGGVDGRVGIWKRCGLVVMDGK
jgi:hypothetical protein